MFLFHSITGQLIGDACVGLRVEELTAMCRHRV